MSIVLRNQVEASERSAQEIERMAAQDRAKMRPDVEALMRQVRDIHDDINFYVERWQAAVAAGTLPYDETFARSLLDLYVRLEKTALKTAQLGRQLESAGAPLDGKKEFLDVWRTLKGIACFSLERVAESLDQIRRGHTTTLGELADELSGDAER
jgi:hypothetical protein